VLNCFSATKLIFQSPILPKIPIPPIVPSHFTMSTAIGWWCRHFKWSNKIHHNKTAARFICLLVWWQK